MVPKIVLLQVQVWRIWSSNIWKSGFKFGGKSWLGEGWMSFWQVATWQGNGNISWEGDASLLQMEETQPLWAATSCNLSIAFVRWFQWWVQDGRWVKKHLFVRIIWWNFDMRCEEWELQLSIAWTTGRNPLRSPPFFGPRTIAQPESECSQTVASWVQIGLEGWRIASKTEKRQQKPSKTFQTTLKPH